LELNPQTKIMHIKTFLLSSLMVALGITASAQSTSKVSFGVRGGFDYQTLNGKNQAGNDLNFDMVPSIIIQNKRSKI
jgi:hypothetical protein